MAFLPENTIFEENIVNSYDLTNGSANFDSSDISRFTSFSLQFVGTNIKGSNVFFIECSNDGTNWTTLTEDSTLPLENYNFIIDKTSFIFKYLRIGFIITDSGTITVKLLAKR